MIWSHQSVATRGQQLLTILLGYLAAAECPSWPGADGLTVDDVVVCYAPALAIGRVPGLEELVIRHPELAEELRSFFAFGEGAAGSSSCSWRVNWDLAEVHR